MSVTAVVPRPARAVLPVVRAHAVPVASLASVAVLLALEVVAVSNHYAMRVTADTPTFLALIRDLAVHPLHPVSVFFGTSDTRSIHASPYLQVLALIWKVVAPAGRRSDPIALGEFVAVVTIPVTLFVLGMLWLYTRELAGRTAAFIAIPVLLAAFGPAHVAFPSDLTLNGFLDNGYFPTTFATGTMLAALLGLGRRTWPWTFATVLFTALTITTDPLNGLVLSGLMIGYSCLRAGRERHEALRVPLVLTCSFVLAGAWPVFDTFAVFNESGVPVPAVILAAFAGPQLWLGVRRALPAVPALLRRIVSVRVSGRGELVLSIFGAWSAAMLAIWWAYTMRHWPSGHAVLMANRLGFYWNDQRDRWLLLFLPAAVGILGLLRLARRGDGEVLLWFFGFYLIGLVGATVHLATGFQLPLYYRFILLCQVPMAIGAAAFVARHKSRTAARVAALTLVCMFALKAVTLVTASDNLTYFGARLPSVWRLGRVIPANSRVVVASDPNTSYFIPVATGNRVLTLGLGHADSGAEATRAETGYQLLRDVYAGSPARASAALRAMWISGVRYVVVEKFTTFTPIDMKHLYAAPYNSLIERRDIDLLASYNSRLEAVGSEVYDDGEFTVFKLDPSKLLAGTNAPSGVVARNRLRIVTLLEQLSNGHGDMTATALSLYRLGVRMVTLSVGALGSTPHIAAYGSNIGDVTYIAIPGKWMCGEYACADSNAIDGLGVVVHHGARFTIVRLHRPGAA